MKLFVSIIAVTCASQLFCMERELQVAMEVIIAECDNNNLEIDEKRQSEEKVPAYVANHEELLRLVILQKQIAFQGLMRSFEEKTKRRE